MLILTKIAEIQGFLDDQPAGATIGLVPTMGALHEGHLSLIKSSRENCSKTICTIFVNPTQFNDKSDLERYPRTPKEDIKMLESAGCDLLFMPGVNEIYPEPTTKKYDFGELDKVLEGKFRPGHFNGVAQVVQRFFEIVKPHKAFFGSKDFQQVLIIKALTKLLPFKVEIVVCPTLREPDGLAMSSRNRLLDAEHRAIASQIPAIMKEAGKIAVTKSYHDAREFVSAKFAAIPDTLLEYYEICDATTLQVLHGAQAGITPVSLIAVFVGKIRLIDNLSI